MSVQDSNGNPFDGGKPTKCTCHRNVPVKDFWSVIVYDNQTRSMIRPTRKLRALPAREGPEDQCRRLRGRFLRPEAPEGYEKNLCADASVQGLVHDPAPLRPYEPWFDKTWRPGEIELLEKPIGEGRIIEKVRN